MNKVIELEKVSFSYGLVPVLQAIDFSVKEGEFLGIVGPNAGGKSTLLKLILGLLKPQTGNITVLGKKPTQQRTQIGYVPQYPGFARDFPITVKQTVLLGRLGASRMLGRYTEADHLAVQQALGELEAQDLAERPISALSGGQLQRILLARALVSEPKILILDEPTANIDMRLETDIFTHLRELNKRLTILVVSHDVAFISDYVSRVACLNRTLVCHQTDAIDGKLIQDLYGEPVRRVAHAH
ncbi:zinc transport system ATP-binding protein [Thiothrix eikelboomii]|uniref:Zinc transport system ATP-binding protein n=1 Tax=Thiothrix eikelboomii TaxID=92487 RepID=A0A1T4WQV3_9GAMM|nr:ABC transporter ATP-binding protein [Thiothrix eikelboomii]SKA79639.1 zinc transport system ATP-binding protein [Thiothrix eikelboomii]